MEELEKAIGVDKLGARRQILRMLGELRGAT
jgi:hypothetical protein